MLDNRELVQLLNTAIIKTKEKNHTSYEERLKEACSRPAIKALGVAVAHLSESEKISCDQAAILIIENIKELDRIWADYVTMEGIHNLKTILKSSEGPRAHA
ncbi:MAG: hypothetical protein A2X86_02900 [Bdellovibrionales bacterium GWA2_49_15]|nr:MAG: hypothetical protein A2X86_02900 [Bdellovibrionales bacterium GWA2_49_15]HAZ14112.1 hypothetical protein [Bdellovibrionales bacterium]